MGYTFTGEMVDLGHGRGWLARAAANSVFRIDAQLGHPLQITEAGRTWWEQNDHFQNFLRDGWPIALNPDTPSLHQVGDAVDSNEAQRILDRMHDNGWRRTVYRWVGGVWTLVEEWHFEHFQELDNRRFDPMPTGGDAVSFQPIPTPEDVKENPMRYALILHKSTNKLIIADMFERKLFDLGDDKNSGLRAYYAQMDYAPVGDREWEATFAGFTYVAR